LNVVACDARPINARMAFDASVALAALTNYGDRFAQPSQIIRPRLLRQI
jgi:hypothetical protein